MISKEPATFASMNIASVDPDNQWSARERKVFPVSLASFDKSRLFFTQLTVCALCDELDTTRKRGSADPIRERQDLLLGLLP